jgi:KDO2-lipid IV(A) lauroyltransferase
VRLADGAGLLWYRLDARRRHRAAENLRVATRGGLAVAERDALVRAAFRQLMRVPLEAFVHGRYVPTARALLGRSRFVGDWARLDRENRAGHGGIILAGHLGSWEVAAAALRWLPTPARVVVRPIDHPAVDRWAARTRGGAARLIRKRGAVREMTRTLEGGGWVGVLADQNAGRHGRFLPFFGLEASTAPAPFVLAARHRVPVYVGAAIRRPAPPFTYEMRLARLEDPPPDLEERAAGDRLLAAYLAVLERWIADVPEQYNWLHRRWKSRPPGEPAGRPLPTYAEPGTPRPPEAPSRPLPTG